jgi:hypothetical protein
MSALAEEPGIHPAAACESRSVGSSIFLGVDLSIKLPWGYFSFPHLKPNFCFLWHGQLFIHQMSSCFPNFSFPCLGFFYILIYFSKVSKSSKVSSSVV